MRGIRKLIVSDRAFYHKVLFLATPIALQSLITIGVNMLDNLKIGSLGEIKLSTVSLANQFISIYHILCMGIGMGASVLVSRYWGMKEREAERATQALKKTLCIMIRLAVGLALVFAAVTFLFPEDIMRMFTTEGAVIPMGVRYFRYSVATYFFLGLSLTCTIVLRSVGQVKIPLMVSVGAFVINLGANYVLIYGKMGLPRMEVAGAALGTLIARVFEAGVIC